MLARFGPREWQAALLRTDLRLRTHTCQTLIETEVAVVAMAAAVVVAVEDWVRRGCTAKLGQVVADSVHFSAVGASSFGLNRGTRQPNVSPQPSTEDFLPFPVEIVHVDDV